jgi:hypothetical protein
VPDLVVIAQCVREHQAAEFILADRAENFRHAIDSIAQPIQIVSIFSTRKQISGHECQIVAAAAIEPRVVR